MSRSLALSISVLLAFAPAAFAKAPAKTKAPAPRLGVVVQQGGVARWEGLGAKRCTEFGKSYPAVDAVCYYPVDFQKAPGRYPIALVDQEGKQHAATLIVERVDFPEVQITLPDDTFVNVSPENLKRHNAERARVLALLQAKTAPPRFTLPLAKPAATLPPSENDFGSLRVFNGTHNSRHTGRDSPVAEGTPIKAVADGTVLLAEEQFFTGNTVFIDHGDGLISMSFHMADLAVKKGDEIKRGQTIGKVGSTGRSTGAHLHLGFRWVGARIDPYLLLDAPSKLPTVGDTPTEAEAKIEKAERKEPKEDDQE